MAIIAHALAVLRRRLDDGRPPVDEGQAVLFALYHDASEILTGDLPTPVKYFNPTIREAYQAVESVAARKLLAMLPEDLAPGWEPYLLPNLDDPSVAATYRLVKAADRISAYIKCIDEEKAGNRDSAKPSTASKPTWIVWGPSFRRCGCLWRPSCRLFNFPWMNCNGDDQTRSI